MGSQPLGFDFLTFSVKQTHGFGSIDFQYPTPLQEEQGHRHRQGCKRHAFEYPDPRRGFQRPGTAYNRHRPERQHHHLHLDTLGRVTSVKAPGDSSATRYAYTTGGCTGCGGPANMIDYITLPEGEVIDFSYDANGELSKITDPDTGNFQPILRTLGRSLGSCMDSLTIYPFDIWRIFR